MGPLPPRRSAAAAAAAAAAIARASGATASQASHTAATATMVAAGSVPAVAATKSRDHVVRLLTFNLWFEPLAMATRMRVIGSYIERHRPAVIGFQEVTRESLTLLRQQRWAQYYDCSADTAPPFSEAYFVVLFSALPVHSLTSHPFANTGMGRELLTACVEVAPGHTLLVGTSHLESLPQFRRERVAQLSQSLGILSANVDADLACMGAILMGDTNLLRGDMKLLDPLAVAEEMTIEEAKTGRSKCRVCSETIDKGTVRVGKIAKDRLPTGKTVEITMWYHRECFLTHRSMPESEKRVVRDASTTHTEAKSEETNDTATRGLPPHWLDLWLAVPGNSEENGYTYDGHRNTMIQNRAYQSRLDRVYLYAPTVASKRAFESIEMIGTEPIADGVWASDHFGLLTTLNFEALVRSKNEVKRKREEVETKTSEPPKRRASGSEHAPIELE